MLALSATGTKAAERKLPRRREMRHPAQKRWRFDAKLDGSLRHLRIETTVSCEGARRRNRHIGFCEREARNRRQRSFARPAHCCGEIQISSHARHWFRTA